LLKKHLNCTCEKQLSTAQALTLNLLKELKAQLADSPFTSAQCCPDDNRLHMWIKPQRLCSREKSL